MADILHVISKFPELSTLTRIEKQMSSPTTIPRATGSRTFVTHETVPAGDFLASVLPSEDNPARFVADSYNCEAILRSFKADKKALLFPQHTGLSDPSNAPQERRSRTRHRA
jgi:hypothetical protein